MTQILVATDLSEGSDRVVRRAGQVARELDARVLVVHVVEDSRAESLVDSQIAAAEAQLAAIISSDLEDLPCEIKVSLGDPIEQITKAASSAVADLIVMGRHRTQILKDLLVRPSAERVVGLNIAPVLIVRAASTGPYRRAIAAVDLSENSSQVLQELQMLGVLRRSAVVLVHAFDALARGKLSYAGASREEISSYVADVAKATKQELTDFLGSFDGDHENWVIHLSEGRPADVIIKLADMERADIVVMGAHGRSGILKMLLGSVTEEVVQRLERDILIIPPRPLQE